MISTILLDAGGVLLDETEHEKAWARAISAILGISLSRYGAAVDESVRNFVPRVYRYVIWQHLAPEECIEVGDRIDKDVIPAKQAGMATILVRTGIHREQQPRLPEEIPDRELSSVKGLAAAARELAEGTGTSSSCGIVRGQ